MQYLDIFAIINIIFSALGILFFIYCILIVKKILKLFPKAKMRKDWKIILILILFFCFGYIFNIIAQIFVWTEVLLIMVAFVYIFGAFFVFIIIRLSYKTYKLILEAAKE